MHGSDYVLLVQTLEVEVGRVCDSLSDCLSLVTCLSLTCKMVLVLSVGREDLRDEGSLR